MHATGSWSRIDSAPRDTALELRVGSGHLSRPLSFPCRLTERGWINALTNEIIDIEPTHWREWRRRDRSSAARALHRVNAMLIGKELSALHTASMDREMPPQLTDLLDKLAAQEASEEKD